jgi:nucleoside-diphosphate-sugar epimerase
MMGASIPDVVQRGAATVLADDLDYCCAQLRSEFETMAAGRLLLTGGAGFLGYYLIQTVLEWNRRVPAPARIALTVLDNYMRGVPMWLQSVAADPALRLVEHDVRTPLPDGCDEFDYVIHAASIASPTFYRQHPIETMDANVNGLRLLLDRSVQLGDAGQGVSGFLFFSSSEIYGDPESAAIPTPETYPGRVSCTGPRACYDESKRYGETLCANFAQRYGIRVAIARPFNNYGPGLKITDRRIIPDLALDLLNGRDLTLHSDGSPSRTFCYIADAIVGYYRILVRGRAGEAYNIGQETPEVTMQQLAAAVVAAGRELFGYSGAIVQRKSADAQYLTDNPRRRCPSIAKARQELGFQPAVSLDDGLRRTLTWYAANMQGDFI